jgi:hypothetical protein
MTPSKTKAAHRGDGGDLRNSQSGRADGFENTRSADQTQYLPDLQAKWLSRRFLIGPALASALAAIVFPEVRK